MFIFIIVYLLESKFTAMFKHILRIHIRFSRSLRTVF